MLKDLLNPNLVTVDRKAKIQDVANLMRDQDVGSVLVVTDGKPKGIITDRDIVVSCIAKNMDIGECTVDQVMTESLETCLETDGVFDCIRKMREAGVRRMPVVDDNGDVTGIISFGDLLGFLSQEFYELTRTTTPAAEVEEKAA